MEIDTVSKTMFFFFKKKDDALCPRQQSCFLGQWICKFHGTLPHHHHLQLRGWGIHPLVRQPVQETTRYETTTM